MALATRARAIEVYRSRASLGLPANASQAPVAGYSRRLTAKPDTATVRVLIRDRSTGRYGTLDIPVASAEPMAAVFRLLLTMFPPIPGLHRLGGLHRLHHLAALPALIHSAGPWRGTAFRRRSRTDPSVAHLLIAGLAVLAFVRLMSAANRGHRSRFTALSIGALLLLVGALVMSFRRSARRYYL